MNRAQARALLSGWFQAAIAAANPARCVPPALAALPPGPLAVYGAGKAASGMARAVETHWPGPLQGFVVAPVGHGGSCSHLGLVEAAHPLPDAAAAASARRMLAELARLDPAVPALFLFSGGGSSLLGLPAPWLEPLDYAAILARALDSGAPIGALNCLRRHLSAIAGGRLGAACTARQALTLAISDVPGDAPHDIASGPTVPDPTRCADALAVAARWAIPLPATARAALISGRAETVKPGDPRLAGSRFLCLARPADALAAAASAARACGFAVWQGSDRLEGEAEMVATDMAGFIRRVAQGQGPVRPPCLLLTGGELSVTRRHAGGHGGRNRVFLLALALALAGAPGIHALAADTDGIDGTRDAAGATLHPDTLARARAAGLDPAAALRAEVSGEFFSALGDAVITGPTGTNVNDFRAILLTA